MLSIYSSWLQETTSATSSLDIKAVADKLREMGVTINGAETMSDSNNHFDKHDSSPSVENTASAMNVFCCPVSQDDKRREMGVTVDGAETTCNPNNSYGRKDSSPSEVFCCPACQEDFPPLLLFQFICGPNRHALCYGCVVEYIKVSKDSGVANICCYEQGCNHTMTWQEIAIALGGGNLDRGRHSSLFKEIERMKLMSMIQDSDTEYASCPSMGCQWTVARSQAGALEKAACKVCHTEFCTKCRGSYHYRTSCAEVEEVHREWDEWVVSGCAQYWKKDRERSRQAKAKSDAETKRIETVRRVHKMDEDYKA